MTQGEKLAHVKQTLAQVLSNNVEFLSLPPERQLGFYKEALASGLQALENGTLARATAANDDPTRLDEVAALAGDFLDQVDFPEFVRDLITGVYDSIVQSTIQQMNAYVDMYKGLAEPLASIARSISETDALGQVASDNPLRFTMGGDGGLTENDTGMKVDTSNDEIQKLMFQARLAMAKERRLLLRETMLMGVQRLVVEKGTIKAGLIFDVKAQEGFKQKGSDTNITQSGGQRGGSFFGLVGGGSSKQKTRIQVTTRDLQTNTELKAQITGHVEVQFKSDYFRLDNFASLFGDDETRVAAEQRRDGAAPGGAPALAPAAQPAR